MTYFLGVAYVASPRVKSYHSERLQCFDAFLHAPEYIVHVPFLPLSAVLSASALPSVVFVESQFAGARMFCSCGR